MLLSSSLDNGKSSSKLELRADPVLGAVMFIVDAGRLGGLAEDSNDVIADVFW